MPAHRVASPDPEPRRPISDPLAIRALAHPTRLTLLEILLGEGHATATRCAELSGHSVASCSFHLRTLARHGFIEAVPAPGRAKPWRLTSMRQELRRDPSDPESAAASSAFDEFFLGHEFARLRAWWTGPAQQAAEAEWRDASVLSGGTGWLTLAELRELSDELGGLVERFFLSRDNATTQRPDGSRPVRLFLGSSVGLFPGEPG